MKDHLDFNDVFSMYVVDHLMKLQGFYLEDAKQVLRLLCKYLSRETSKDYQLILLRKMGVPMTVLVKGDEDILLEDSTEIIACANLVEFESALKNRFHCFLLDKDMEKAMASQSSTPAWKIPWTEEPGWLQSMGSL